MISMASLFETILNRRDIEDLIYDERNARSFRLWLRKAWEASEKGMEYRALTMGAGEAKQ